MPSLYLETTIPSYLAAHPSRDLVTAAHQQITHEWWFTGRDRFDLHVSEAVLDEIRRGGAHAAGRRLAIIADLPVLAFSADVASLIQIYSGRLGLLGSGTADLPHFAYAVAYKMDYLVTWNCAHIANGDVIRRLVAVNAEIGRPTPVIVTPESLLAEYRGDSE